MIKYGYPFSSAEWERAAEWNARFAKATPSAWNGLSARCAGETAKIPVRVSVRVKGQQETLEPLRFQGFLLTGVNTLEAPAVRPCTKPNRNPANQLQFGEEP